MIAIDTNILIHLLVESQKEHKDARHWLMNNKDPLATTGTNIAEVLRLLTHPRVFAKPLSLIKAVELVNRFIVDFSVNVLVESDTWWMELKSLVENIPSLKGDEIFDARIALCLCYHRIKLVCTLDANFSKYPFLKIVTI